MWAIGRPNAIMSLSGHSSAVESVTFDTTEAYVAAGAASGTIKLWDLEEAKIVRTLTGHRSNCISVDFHPFGEFFASGSLDTNLKIWDIRRKGCIHTYKGHTRGVNAIKFSPDGRWVVSGGEDNLVKLWDLTAGKLMHDFKCHEGQVLCLDFHPHEFLLATGSADRTVKFWDLETFELIGSAGPETTGVRSMIFNPDGRTLLAGLHENLKVFSWEPLRCHDVIDVGWSKLADLNIHEGKLLGCSYNQSCVGIWVVDLTRVGPYASSNNRANGVIINQPSQQMIDGSLKSSSVIRNVAPHSVESSMKEMKLNTTSVPESAPATPQRGSNAASTKGPALASTAGSAYMLASRRVGAGKVQSSSAVHPSSKLDTAPVIVPRISSGPESVAARPALDVNSMRNSTQLGSLQTHDSNKLEVSEHSNESPRVELIMDNGSSGHKSPVSRGRITSSVSLPCSETPSEVMPVASDSEHGNVRWIGTGKFRRNVSLGAQRGSVVRRMQPPFPDEDGVRGDDRYNSAREASSIASVEVGRVRSVASVFEKKETVGTGDGLSMHSGHVMRSSVLDGSSFTLKGSDGIRERSSSDTITMIDDSDVIEQLMEQHKSFTSAMQSRLTKLQVVRRFWARNDLKGAVEAMSKMGDHSVLVDVLSCLVDRGDAFTLEVCTLLLPLLNGLLSSTYERYLSTALAVLLILVRNFGQIIHTTRTASPSFGVDLHAEERIERCNSCYVELQGISQSLTPLLRKGGDIGKSAQELSIALQEV
ncbi:hypothetical protein KP509_32G074800 [Ceratopteris richardii]|nr:hypothetical protein KP509_32G074800 [Ceratopteris richardii]